MMGTPSRVLVPMMALLLTLLLVRAFPAMSGTASEGPSMLPLAPEKVADYLYAIIQADRSFYTSQVVKRLQEHEIITATEHWEQEGTLPLPAQFLQHAGQMVAEGGSGIRFRLISLYPISQKNSPATAFERQALETLTSQAAPPVKGLVASGKKRYLQAVYPDRATSEACVSCHNHHPLSPKRDFRLNDTIGAIAITIPVE